MTQDTSEALFLKLVTPENINHAINALLERHKDRLTQSSNFCVVFFWTGSQLEFYLYRSDKPITVHLRKRIAECLNLSEIFFDIPGKELKDNFIFSDDLNDLWEFARRINAEVGRLFIGSFLESPEDFTNPKGLNASDRLLYELLDSKAKCRVRLHELIKHLFDKRNKFFKRFKTPENLFRTSLKQDSELIFWYLTAVSYAEFSPRKIAKQAELFIKAVSEDAESYTDTLRDKILLFAKEKSKKPKGNKTRFLLSDYNNARQYYFSCLRELMLYRNNENYIFADHIYDDGSLKHLRNGRS